METYIQPNFLQGDGTDQGGQLLLNVTSEHPLVRLAEEDNQGSATLIEAKHSLGARIPLYDLKHHQSSSGRVQHQVKAHGTKKNLLFTEHCNVVLSNGLV